MHVSSVIVILCGAFLALLGVLPFDMSYDEFVPTNGKLMLAVTGIVFVAFGVVLSFVTDMWR